MTLYSIGEGKGADTDIRFFDSEFSELPRKKFFKEPDLKDFVDIPKGSVTTLKEIRGMLPFYTTEFVADATDNNLKGTLTVGEFIDQDDMNILKLFLRPDITYVWTGTKFRLDRH